MRGNRAPYGIISGWDHLRVDQVLVGSHSEAYYCLFAHVLLLRNLLKIFYTHQAENVNTDNVTLSSFPTFSHVACTWI